MALDLRRLLKPRGIAIIGASSDPNRIGGQPIRSLTEFGYQGHIFPVNPKYQTIGNLPCFPDVRRIDKPCDVALIALPTKFVADAIRGCGEAGIPYAVVLSAGFAEVGEAGREAQADLRAAISESGVRVVGPNCVGVLNLEDRVFCGFGALFKNGDRPIGSAAIVTQSGGFGGSIVSLAEASGLAFKYVVSSGNEIDITTVDLLDWYLEQPDVDVIVSYLEGVSNGTRLRSAGRRALELGKPILVWKVGNTQAGRKSAASHTAAMTGRYELYKEAFREGGFVEVDDVQDLVDIAHAFQTGRFPKSKNVAVVSVSGGAGVLLADRCSTLGLELPPLSGPTRDALAATIPDFGSLQNPVDLTAQGHNSGVDPFMFAVRQLLADPGVDQVIARGRLAIQGEAAETFARELCELAAGTEKPLILAGGFPAGRSGNAESLLAAGHVSYYPTPARAAICAASLATFAEKTRRIASQPTSERLVARQPLSWPAGTGTTLSEFDSKQCLRRYGIPVVPGRLLALSELDALDETSIPFPVCVKINSPDIPHKTEAGAVRLNVRNMIELKEAANAVNAAALRYLPRATITGILVEEMAKGTEFIIGAVDDATFGPTVMFGLGGIAAELLKDVAFKFAPLDVAAAREMILSTRIGPLFQGYRGQQPLDLDALAETIARVSLLIADHADRIAEVDLNPVFVRPRGEGCTVADALIVAR